MKLEPHGVRRERPVVMSAWMMRQGTRRALGGDDPVLALMRHFNLPVTRDDYLNLAHLGRPPEQLSAEEEAELPKDLCDQSIMGITEMSGKIVRRRQAKKYRNATSRSKGLWENDAYRVREHLTEAEIENLLAALKDNRHGHRDWLIGLIIYRHGLRASEVVVLRWDDIDLNTGRLHVRRAKGGDASVHPISARESRALRRLLREAPKSLHVFISERRAPLSAAGYQRMVARAGVAAKFTFPIHSHMLRHACGFKLANDGHDTRAIQAYLGRRSIMSTVRYTAVTPNRFKHFWKD
jgi:integrase